MQAPTSGTAESAALGEPAAAAALFDVTDKEANEVSFFEIELSRRLFRTFLEILLKIWHDYRNFGYMT